MMHGVKKTIMITNFGRIIVNTCPTNVGISFVKYKRLSGYKR